MYGYGTRNNWSGTPFSSDPSLNQVGDGGGGGKGVKNGSRGMGLRVHSY